MGRGNPVRSFISLYSPNNKKENEYMNIENLNLKPVKDFENYYISECGKVVSFKMKKPRIMKAYLGSSGYRELKLCENNKATHKIVHRMVAEAFVPNPNNLPVVHHKDNNQQNNHFSNLEWTTQRQNIAYSYETTPPKRNFKRCELHHIKNGFIKSFDDKNSACDYARENFNCSKTSLMKYLKTGEYKLILNV